MSSSGQKGNNHTTFLIITAAIMLFLLGILGELMLTEGVRNGKYNNPRLAEKVVPGTIYGHNSTVLAIEIPSYEIWFDLDDIKDMDAACQTVSLYTQASPSYLINLCRNSQERQVCVVSGIDSQNITPLLEELNKTDSENSVYVVKNYTRSYPFTFHCSQLISQTEKALKNIIEPRPGFNETITYGQDVYLTIVPEIQYILDLAIEKLVSETSCNFKAMIVDVETCEVLGMTSTPFSLPSEDNINELAYTDSIRLEDGTTVKPFFLMDYDPLNYKEIGYVYSDSSDSGFSQIIMIPNSDSPKYVLYLNSEKTVKQEFIQNAALTIQNGMAAQGKVF